jgi:hypothetical protein
MKHYIYLFCLFSFSFLPISVDSKNLKPSNKTILEKKIRGPNSEQKVCNDPIKAAQENFGREFDLSKSEIAQVYITTISFNEFKFSKATHPNFCTPKGCNTLISVIKKKGCPKALLAYTGDFKFLGPENKKYMQVEVTYRAEAVDGGKRTEVLVFDESKLEFQLKSQ